MLKLSIRLRFTLIILALQVLVLGFILNEALSRYYQGTLNQLRTVEHSILEVTGELSRTSMFAGDYEVIQTYIERLKDNPVIDGILLANNKQIIIAATDPNQIGNKLVSSQDDPSTLWQYLELSNIAEQLGTLAIHFSDTPINTLHEEIVIMAISWSVAGLSLSIIFSLIAGYFLTQRITRISDAAKSIDKGNLNVDLNIRGNDEITTLAHVFEDMVMRLASEQERLETLVNERTAKLTASNHELEAFSYSVSHDLRAPLRAISGFTQALAEEYEPLLDEQGKTFIKRVLANTQRMSELIDAMLSLSRISRKELKMIPVDMSNMVNEVFQQYSENDVNRSVTLSLEDKIMGFGDPNMLRIVFENLIGNAWKYTQKAPDPHIEFGQQDKIDHVIYFVRDNGCGFDPRFDNKIFDPFQRANANEFEGLGIGLATVKRIILRHGGKIWAKSEIGNGATFYFTLPKRIHYVGSDPG